MSTSKKDDKTDKNACVPFNETLKMRFIRLALLFQEKDSTYIMVIFKHYDINEAAAIFGLASQGWLGDMKKPKPSPLNYLEYEKWKAWNAYRGLTKDEAMK